jgi:hypothetical protein
MFFQIFMVISYKQKIKYEKKYLETREKKSVSHISTLHEEGSNIIQDYIHV